MKTKTMTQLELATLAANLATGTAPERVKLAMAIWREAGNEMDGTAEIERISSRLDDYEAAPVPLEWLLADLLPKKSKAERMDRWKRFIHWKMENARDAGTIYGTRSNPAILSGDKITPAIVRELAEGEIHRHAEEGVKHFLTMSDQFKAWTKKETGEAYAERARKGGIAKKKRDPETRQPESKARGKTHQVKKRAKR